ncbi:MAG: hypothetical protein LBM25_05360 [Bacteroidales bacterium]|jgi:hypothetical protein|nr:hypothetical protein [Bacteroidales bacterium]
MKTKRLLILTFILPLLFIYSCKDDSNDNIIKPNPSNPSKAISLSFDEVINLMDKNIDSVDLFLKDKGLFFIDSITNIDSSRVYASSSLPLYTITIVGSMVNTIHIQINEISGDTPLKLYKEYLNASTNYTIDNFVGSISINDFTDYASFYSFLNNPENIINSSIASYDITPTNEQYGGEYTKSLYFTFEKAQAGSSKAEFAFSNF